MGIRDVDSFLYHIEHMQNNAYWKEAQNLLYRDVILRFLFTNPQKESIRESATQRHALKENISPHQFKDNHRKKDSQKPFW